MTKTSKKTCPQGKKRRTHKKKCPKVENDSYNIIDLLQQRYRNILGPKKPLVVLQRVSIPSISNKNYNSQVDLHIKSNKVSKEIKSMYLEKNVNIKESDEFDFSIFNEKLESETVPTNKTIETKHSKSNNNIKRLNTHVEVFKGNYKAKKGRSNSNRSKKKKCASNRTSITETTSTTNSESELLDTKCADETMEIETLRYETRLRNNVQQAVNYDENLNIVYRNVKGRRKSSTDSDTISTTGFWEWNKSIKTDDMKLENEYDSEENVKRIRSKTGNSKQINSVNTLHYDEDLLKTITPMNGMVSNGTIDVQAANTVHNHGAKAEDTSLMTDIEQDLTLKNQLKDYESKNAIETKKLPFAIKTSILDLRPVKCSTKHEIPKKDISKNIVVSGKDKNIEQEDFKNIASAQKSLPEISVFKSTDVQHKTTKKNISSVTNCNLLEKSDEKRIENSVIKIKGSIKSSNDVHVKTNINEQKCTLKNITSKNNPLVACKPNATNNDTDTAFSSLPVSVQNSIFRTDINTNESLKERKKISVSNTSMFNNSSVTQAEEKCSIVREQKVTNKAVLTTKINYMPESLDEYITGLSKRKHSNDSPCITNENTKKIKLNRHHWLQSVNVTCEDSKETNTCNESSITKPNIDKIVPKIGITNVTQSDILTHNENNENRNIQIVETGNGKITPGLVEQEHIVALNGTTNVQNHNSLQNPWKSQEIPSQMQKLPTKDESLISDQTNCNESTEDYEDEDDSDCISLFADSTLIEEYDVPVTSIPQNSRNSKRTSEKSYVMTDNVFKKYYESTTSEFNKAYATCNANNCENNTLEEKKKPIALRLGKPVTNEKNPVLTNKETFCYPPPQKQQITKTGTLFTVTFRGFCFSFIKYARCQRVNCQFKHDSLLHLLSIYTKNEKYFFETIEQLILLNYNEFVMKFYYSLVYYFSDITCILKVLKKLFEFHVITHKIGVESIALLERRGVVIEQFLGHLTAIVNINDTKFVNWILNLVQDRIRIYLRNGEYWNVLKPLIIKIEYLDSTIIENILRECLLTRKNIQDIKEYVIDKINSENSVSQELLTSFKNLLEYTANEKQVIKESTTLETIDSINSPTLSNEVNQTDFILPISNASEVTTPKVWKNVANNTKEPNNNNNTTQNENNFITLHPIDDLPKPYSPLSRKRFWKFYLDLHSLQEGLKHGDRNHVMKILKSADKEQKSCYSRACYQILCNEIKSSQFHLSELVSLAVRYGATTVAYEILLDVMKHILARLAENEFWILAFKLLKNINVIQTVQSCFSEFDASTVLLFTEIYLANRQAIKAFKLLKQTNIIYPDRNKWKPRNNAKDDYIRARIVALLLDAFCKFSLEYAFFLFEFLVINQSSNFYPVDLSRPANKIVSMTLLKKDHEMIVDVTKLIDNYSIILNTVTYRALITALVNIDIALAKQMYYNAIGLGIYSDVKFHPVTCIIVNSDWTKEEMYLSILNLMQQLSSNIGHAMDRVNAKQLPVHIVFQNVPSEKQLSCNEGKNQQCIEKINESKILMKSVLRKKFSPPISMLKRNKSIFKLTGKSIQQYLIREYHK